MALLARRNIPTLNLLCMEQKFIDAFKSALPVHWPGYLTLEANDQAPIKIKVHHSSLRFLPVTTKFDLIVSPANSYGRLDGSFDEAISRQFCLPNHDLETLTNAAQQVLYEKWRGYAPPGTCTLVPFPPELVEGNGWGCKWLGVCPTMRTPCDVRWDREIVYECTWSLLCAVEAWNRAHQGGASWAQRIESVLVTPLATGCGAVNPDKWAAQFVLALKHFADAVQKPARWSHMDWTEIYDDAHEVSKTWNL